MEQRLGLLEREKPYSLYADKDVQGLQWLKHLELMPDNAQVKRVFTLPMAKEEWSWYDYPTDGETK